MPAKPPQYGQLKQPFPKVIDDYLKNKGIELYSHQTEVIEKIRDGKNVVLTTSTASGKTLAFILPILEGLDETLSTALFLYPMKALTYDQLKNIQEIEEETAIDIRPAVYDGDTPKSARRNIRETSRIILTNPYALHYYLSWHHIWTRFFANIKYLVVDEGHWYRGVYGTNVAFLLRRLFRILEYYDSNPQIIMASATMADPLGFAHKLTGKDFDLVNKDGSAKGKKTYLFWDTAKEINRSQHMQTADLLSTCVESGLQTLCFAVSRKMTELTAIWANELTSYEIAPYRAGYLPEERRKTERMLKNGEISGIVSTNALELGINIGGLDAVVIGGYPGTISSFHQRAGRAGRSGQDSLVIQSIYNNPLDAYLLAKPSYLFETPSEQAVISLDNRRILKAHLLCAAEELPLKKKDEKWFGPEYISCVRELFKEGKVCPKDNCKFGKDSTASQYIYPGKGSCFNLQLNNIEDDTYKLVHEHETLEKIGKRQAFMEAHPGAIYFHKGQAYESIEVNHYSKTIQLQPSKEDIFTSSLIDTDIQINKVLKKRKIGKFILNFGNLNVTETVYGYSKNNRYQSLGREILAHPLSTTLETQGVWISFGSNMDTIEGSVHAAEHILIGVAPLLSMCDRWDIGGLSSPEELFIYEAFNGGIGVTEHLYAQYEVLVNKSIEVLKNCSCDNGCPRCIISPKCGNGNEPLSKRGALILLKQI